MKLLVIGTDTNIFRPNSEARSRIEDYAGLFDELHIVIYTASGFYEETLPSGVRLYPTNSRMFFLRPFDAARLSKKIVQEERIDMVSVQDPAESGVAGWLVKRNTGVPLHIQLHTDMLSPYFRKNSWKERLRYCIARFIITKGDRFRVVSRRIRDSLHSSFGIQYSRIAVLPIFVDKSAIAASEPSFDLGRRYPEFDFIILMVSRLHRDKRIDAALDAFYEFKKEFPKAGLVIVGDGPERKQLELSATRYSLSASVRFEGWQEDIIPYYKGADLYLLTSAFEGYGRSVVEAAAASTPVIMTDVGVAGEAIRDKETGRVVPVGDHRSLVKALIEARQNYPAMQKMAERAQKEIIDLGPRTRQEYLQQYRLAFDSIRDLS